MSGKRDLLRQELGEGGFTGGKEDVKKPKMEIESRTPLPAPSVSPPIWPENPEMFDVAVRGFSGDKGDGKKPKSEIESRTPSPPISPENPEMFDIHLKVWGLAFAPGDVRDDEIFLTKAESSHDEKLYPTDTDDEKLYPTDTDLKIYTPDRLTGYAKKATDKYNKDKKVMYTFQGLHEVLSRCSNDRDRTFTIFFWAAATGSDAQLFKAFAASGFGDGDLGLGSESDYYDVTILEVDLLPASPPQ